MADSHGGAFGPAAARELTELGVRVRGFGATRGPGTFDPEGAQPAIAFAGFATFVVARTLVVTWTEPDPGGGVLSRGKATHV